MKMALVQDVEAIIISLLEVKKQLKKIQDKPTITTATTTTVNSINTTTANPIRKTKAQRWSFHFFMLIKYIHLILPKYLMSVLVRGNHALKASRSISLLQNRINTTTANLFNITTANPINITTCSNCQTLQEFTENCKKAFKRYIKGLSLYFKI
ncbi:hypothetical protein C2G38_1421067 [Gigaspora rosea]|uniref:Uncharacterized protein n=1 Tax=Gigaspora rosea TaxID=44941 RepID=A0A397VE35_9GLOM|nr:hypothetical protein C2G38_1421067 [Gigaspora rosea]